MTSAGWPGAPDQAWSEIFARATAPVVEMRNVGSPFQHSAPFLEAWRQGARGHPSPWALCSTPLPLLPPKFATPARSWTWALGPEHQLQSNKGIGSRPVCSHDVVGAREKVKRLGRDSRAIASTSTQETAAVSSAIKLARSAPVNMSISRVGICRHSWPMTAAASLTSSPPHPTLAVPRTHIGQSRPVSHRFSSMLHDSIAVAAQTWPSTPSPNTKCTWYAIAIPFRGSNWPARSSADGTLGNDALMNDEEDSAIQAYHPFSSLLCVGVDAPGRSPVPIIFRCARGTSG